MTSELTFDQQLENVRQCMVAAELELLRDYGKTGEQAETLIAANLGRGLLNRSYPWWIAAAAYVGAHRQWREMMDAHEAELAQAEQDARQALLASSPIQAGDRVCRRDGAIGIVRHIFLQAGRVKAAVDWPAPQRIGGDGWHRSVVSVASLTKVSTGAIRP